MTCETVIFVILGQNQIYPVDVFVNTLKTLLHLRNFIHNNLYLERRELNRRQMSNKV